MIPNNLKVGDTFADGCCTYKVKEVCKDGNYISELVSVGITAVASEEPRRRRRKEVEE